MRLARLPRQWQVMLLVLVPECDVDHDHHAAVADRRHEDLARTVWALDDRHPSEIRDDLPSFGGAYGAYRCATNGGGGWGTCHTGNVRAAHTSRPFAIWRKVQPASPSACRAATSCSVRHSAWQSR
jgi:hypothetical protein